jgi:TetR/AcrR family transcriptional regulator
MICHALSRELTSHGARRYIINDSPVSWPPRPCSQSMVQQSTAHQFCLGFPRPHIDIIVSSPSSPPLPVAMPAAASASECPIGATVAALARQLPKVRQRRKAARPQELLDAALTLFVERGLAATRTEDVARHAGVSKGTLYLYYPSKDALFKAVVRNYLGQVVTAGAELTNQFNGTSSELLQLLAHTWWTQVGSSKAAALMNLIMSEASAFPDLAQFYVNEVVEPSHALLARVIRRGIDRGEFRSMDVTSVVQALIAPALFLVLYQQCTAVCAANPVPMDPERFMQTQIELFLRGLEVRPQP